MSESRRGISPPCTPESGEDAASTTVDAAGFGAFLQRNAMPVGLMVLLLVAIHALLLSTGVTPKLFPMAATFQAMEAGGHIPLGTMLSVSGVELGGPLYYWLHYPLAWLGLPFYSFHLMYLVLELAALALWLALARRHFPERLVLWAGLALVLCPYTKSELGESSLFLVVLPWLTLLTLLSALRRGRRAAFILPALLWGVALQFHLSALFIAPAVLAAVWRAGGRRLGNLGVLAGTGTVAGLLPTFLPLLAQQDRLARLGELSRLVVQERSALVILLSLSTVLAINAPALVGLFHQARSGRRPSWTWWLGLWLLVPLGLVLLMDPDDFKPWHYVIMSPAFGVFTGVAMARLEAWGKARSVWHGRVLRLETWAGALLLLVVLALGLLHAVGGRSRANTCDLARRPQLPGSFATILDAARTFRQGTGMVRFSGLAHDHLSGGFWFETRAARLDFWAPSPEPGDREVFVGLPSPALEDIDASAQLLAASTGLQVVTPSAVLRPGFRKTPGRITSRPFDLPHPAPRYAVVYLEGDLGFAHPDLVLTSGVGSDNHLGPSHKQVCQQWGLFVGQYTFDLSTLRDTGLPLQLLLAHRTGVVNYLAEIVLFSWQ